MIHTTKIVTAGNGGAKSRRASCSCGFLGGRSAFGPLAGGRSVHAATADAEQDAAEHVAKNTH